MAGCGRLRALLLMLCGMPAAYATSTCSDGWVCVDEVTTGGAIELHARNLREVPVTYTLTVETQGAYRVVGEQTVTDTLRPRDSRRAMALEPTGDQPGGRYSISIAWAVGDQFANHDDDHIYALPYTAGRAYRVLQGYNSRLTHRGREEFAIDFEMPVGTPVHAARAGIVARVVEEHDHGCATDGCDEYANYIVILHNDGTTGEYYHLAKDGALVTVGESVGRGQKIGLSGNTGHSTRPHLHFGVYRATSSGHTQSIPVRFSSADGIVMRPRRGAFHQALY